MSSSNDSSASGFTRRPLPPRPNLEHLKHQAQVRLRELRAVDSEAKLADAQFSVAREYGFDSWRVLKAHVEAVSDGDTDAAFMERVEELIAAARAGDAAKTSELIDTDPRIVTVEAEVPHWYNERYQALHVACGEGHLDVVRRLVEAGADVNAVGREGLTPLSLAAHSGNRDLAGYLISEGAEVDICVAAKLGDLDGPRHGIRR